MPELPITTTAQVQQRRGDILYEVRLPEGKIVLGHLSKELRQKGRQFLEGETIVLEMTPYDFDQGRIIGIFRPPGDTSPEGSQENA